MGRRLAAIAGGIALVLVGACTSPKPTPAPTATATGQDVTFEPGSDGLGDSYYPKAGNGGYDVSNYALDLRYGPATDTLTGKAVITATATESLSRFNLDFVGLKTEKVTVNGADAMGQHNDAELVITPAAGIADGSTFTVEVRYSGVPTAYTAPRLGQIGFLHTDDGAIAIGEPQVAASWFPVNDHPRDKATYTIAVAAPNGLTAISNGVLKAKRTSGGVTTWTWSESKPMAPYLATIVIGKYRVTESTHDGKPVVLAVDTSLPTQIDTQMARTPAVIDFLESKFGPYPFDAMGGIVVDDQRIRFALENQTRPIYGHGFFDPPGTDATWVIVHEIAHQWYGDSVSVNQWKDIWLNEGFATYAEWLWAEEQGEQSAQEIFNGWYGKRDNPIWRVPPGDPGEPNLFDGSVYTRGGMTLHALRLSVGDEAFFRILKNWASEKANANATTSEFITLSERISGKQLDKLFQDWLYGTVRPPRP